MKYLRNITRGWIDGVLTALGIVIGSAIGGNNLIVITAGLAGGIGSSFASIASSITAERAAVYKEIVDLEEKMMLEKNHIRGLRIFKKRLGEASERGVVDGVSTFSGAIIPIIPFTLFSNIVYALSVSIILSLSLLFILGMIIGKISKENMVKWGLKTLLLGMITFIIVELIQLVLKI